MEKSFLSSVGRKGSVFLALYVKVIDILINLIVGIISLCIRISNYHAVQRKYITILSLIPE